MRVCEGGWKKVRKGVKVRVSDGGSEEVREGGKEGGRK